MKAQYITSVLTILSTAAGQTPSGFTPSVDLNLIVTYGSDSISPPGEQLQRSEVASRPNISRSSNLFSKTGRAVLIMIDPDVPRNGARVPNLHWLAPDITGSVDGTNTTELTLAAPNNADGVPYLQPSPPIGDFAHRYIFLLFEQPRTFSIPTSFGNLTANRLGFDLSSFITQSGLTTPFAANYMLVANNNGPATTSYPPASFSVSTTISVARPSASATTTGSDSSATGSSSASKTSAAASANSTSSSAATLERWSSLSIFMTLIWIFL